MEHDREVKHSGGIIMLQCKYCDSLDIKKAGKRNDIQRYRCKECARYFMEDYSPSPKQTIEECSEQYLSDPSLKEGLNSILSIFNEMKIKPTWYHSKSYIVHYKKNRVIYIGIDTNWLKMKVCTTDAVYNDNGKLDAYLQMVSVDVKDEFLRNIQYCTNCGTCHSYDIELLSETFSNVCERSWYYTVTNPTQGQIGWIKKFIFSRIEYIKNAINGGKNEHT